MTRQPDHPISPMFADRWSPRAFSEAAMTEAQMLTILEAARWAPSASNNQPWRLVWALRGEEAFTAIMGCLAEGNRAWAPKAAGVIVVAARQTVTREGEERPNRWAEFDTGAAWAQMALQARSLGLYTHAMGGFDAAALGPVVNLPERHALMAVVVVGERAGPETLSEAQQAREVPNQRLPLSETTRRGRF